MQRFTLITENRPGVLARVAGQVNRRTLNIEEFTARNLPGRRRTVITIDVECDDRTAERLAKGMERLVNVLEVTVGRVPTEPGASEKGEL
jgi:acetolactate synthase-1/3 small subunit